MDGLAQYSLRVDVISSDVTLERAAARADRYGHHRFRQRDLCPRVPVPRQTVGPYRPFVSRTADVVMTALAISNVVLWIVVLALLVVVFALTRQLGVLHERIAPAGALMINRGLAVGEQAPAIDVVDLNGQSLRVGAERPDGFSTLIIFLSPTCPVCES